MHIDETLIPSISQRIGNRLNELKASHKQFDVHCHIFNYDYIPDKYFGIRLPFIINEKFLKFAEELLDEAWPFSDDDPLSHVAWFLRYARTKTMGEIADDLAIYYPPNTAFCPLMMDLWPGIGGKMLRPFEDQMTEMESIVDRNPETMFPFLAIDPNVGAEKVKERFMRGFSEGGKFWGVKIYPGLGYKPSHKILMEIFRVCEARQIPVTTHCGDGTVHTTRKLMLQRYMTYRNNRLKRTADLKFMLFKKQYGNYFNAPENWEPVLRTYPNLKLNLAHFGFDDHWEKYMKGESDTWVHRILDLMQRYKNVYTDLAFVMRLSSNNNYPFMDTLRHLYETNSNVHNKLLYGTDFYMVTSREKIQHLIDDFTQKAGAPFMHQISHSNALKFLFEDSETTG